MANTVSSSDYQLLNRMDRYLLANVPSIANLQKVESETVIERVKTAISRVETASLDHYNNVLAVSFRWDTDDTGSEEDSSLFMETIIQLKNEETTVHTKERILEDNVDFSFSPLLSDLTEDGRKMDGRRKPSSTTLATHLIMKTGLFSPPESHRGMRTNSSSHGLT
jgi:hypothetical protein